MRLVFPKLKQWQKDVFDWFEPKGKTAVVLSARQMGKSFLCLALLLKVAATQAKSTSIVVEPTLAQSRKMFNDFMKAIGDSGVIEKANESLLHIRFINKSEILFKSAEQADGLRGYTVSGILILDECAFIPQKIIDIVLPTTTVHKASILICSTPLTTDGYFYQVYSSEDTDSKKSFNWAGYDRSDMISEEQIAFYKRTYAKNKFTTEILGQFLQNDGALFTGIEDCIGTASNEDNLYFGIDWASGNGNDNTVITCLNGLGEMVFITYLNDMTPTDQIERIVKLINRYQPIKVTVESNSIGSIYFDMLQEKVQIRISKFNTTNVTKNKIVEKLSVALENQDITILRDDELLTELRMYAAERTRSGKTTYNAPSGYKDDAVVSLAICWDSLFTNRGNYSLSFSGYKSV